MKKFPMAEDQEHRRGRFSVIKQALENLAGSDRGVSHSAAAPQPRFATELSRAPSLARPLRLETLSEKELAHQCFSSEDEEFLDGLMEQRSLGGLYGGPLIYSGWYPNLFYRAVHWTDFLEFHRTYGAGAFDGLVADVHTDVPCDVCGGDPGCVLHEAVGRVNLLMIAVDSGPDRFVCAGPVLSHYEIAVLGAPRRLSDEEWRGIIANNFPSDLGARRIEGLSPPVWTRSYLVLAQ